MRGRAGSFLKRTTGARPDLFLRPGDDVRFDLDALTGALGKVTGRVLLNNQPATSFEVRLQLAKNPAATPDQKRTNEFISRMASRIGDEEHLGPTRRRAGPRATPGKWCLAALRWGSA